jgi:hypothetical protein
MCEVVRLQDVTRIEVSVTDGEHTRVIAYVTPAKIHALLSDDSSMGDLLRDLVLAEPTRKVPGVQ